LFGLRAQRIEDDAWFDARFTAFGIDRKNAVHVFREIEKDGGIAALTGQTRTCPARKDRRLVGPAYGQGGADVISVSGDDDADRRLTVIGCIRRVQSSASEIKADFAAYCASKRAFKLGGL
jgi:hypothetical protein